MPMRRISLTQVSRREPYLAGSPQYTPYEDNKDHFVEEQGNVYVPTRIPDSLFNSRRARHRTVFFLQPTGDSGSFGDWMMSGFDYVGSRYIGKEALNAPNQHMLGITQGVWTLEDQRRNIDVPPTESYGDYVGSNDGVAPYGLD